MWIILICIPILPVYQYYLACIWNHTWLTSTSPRISPSTLYTVILIFRHHQKLREGCSIFFGDNMKLPFSPSDQISLHSESWEKLSSAWPKAWSPWKVWLNWPANLWIYSAGVLLMRIMRVCIIEYKYIIVIIYICTYIYIFIHIYIYIWEKWITYSNSKEIVQI